MQLKFIEVKRIYFGLGGRIFVLSLLLLLGLNFVYAGGACYYYITGTVTNQAGDLQSGVLVDTTCGGITKTTATNSMGVYTTTNKCDDCNSGSVASVNCNSLGFNATYLTTPSSGTLNCRYGDNFVAGLTKTRNNYNVSNVYLNITVNGTVFNTKSDSNFYYYQKITSTANTSDYALINISYGSKTDNLTTTINSLYNPTFYSNLFFPTKPTVLTNNSQIIVGKNVSFSASGSTDLDGDTLTYYYEFYDINKSITLADYSTTKYLILWNNLSNHKLRVRAKSYDTSNYSNFTELNYTILDGLSITPLNTIVSLEKNQSFSDNVYIATGNVYENVSFSISCNSPSYNVSCIMQNNKTIQDVTLNYPDATDLVSFALKTNESAISGTYNGNITIIRDSDNLTNTLYWTTNVVDTPLGKPVLVNYSSFYSWSSVSNEVTYYPFSLFNNGTYDLTNCKGKLDGAFTGFNFYSFTDGVNVSINQSVLFNLTFNSPSTGSFYGYMDIICNSSALSVNNSIPIKPYITLAVTPYIPPTGGGGGGGSQEITIIEGTNFTISPRILDTYYIITNLNPEIPKIWNYTFIATRNIAGCSVNNGFSCSFVDNKVTVIKYYTKDNVFTLYDKATLTLNSGEAVITEDFSVRVINFAYYIPLDVQSFPSILEDLSIVHVENGVMTGINILPFMFIFLIIGFVWVTIIPK